ncbi:MAG: NAD(P)/FAD-dependent oxidoreductase [Candidatus Delongbacteria bacterium]|nr:NAD(P)/FAD-dependent oxidoreductase [Candidatus Delongbacteria bacterium]
MRYDVAIIGAGPAGSQTAYYLAGQGYRVLMLEKRAVVGEPVRCAEAAGLRTDLERYFPIDSSWEAGQIDSGYLVAPNGQSAYGRINSIAQMVHRNRFDQFLADRAQSAGAELRLSCQAIGAGYSSDGIKIEIRNPHRLYHEETRFLIGADGTESQVGRWFGCYSSIPPRDMMTCLEYALHPKNPVEFNSNSLYFYLGHQIAPGGYAWIFPKQDGTYNVGLGIDYRSRRTQWPADYLNPFCNRFFPQAEILRTIAGGTPFLAEPKRIVTDRVALVGDAGGHCNPLTGGGIMNALEAGKILADTLLPLLLHDRLSQSDLKPYPETWLNTYGKPIRRFYKIRHAFFSLQDHDLNAFVSALNDILKIHNQGMRIPDVLNLLIRIILKNPSLCLKLGKSCIPLL